MDHARKPPKTTELNYLRRLYYVHFIGDYLLLPVRRSIKATISVGDVTIIQLTVFDRPSVGFCWPDWSILYTHYPYFNSIYYWWWYSSITFHTSNPYKRINVYSTYLINHPLSPSIIQLMTFMIHSIIRLGLSNN